jgi:hypothetical protein
LCDVWSGIEGVPEGVQKVAALLEAGHCTARHTWLARTAAQAADALGVARQIAKVCVFQRKFDGRRAGGDGGRPADEHKLNAGLVTGTASAWGRTGRGVCQRQNRLFSIGGVFVHAAPLV